MLPVEGAHQFQQPLTDLRVDIGGGFVGKHNVRGFHQCARNRHPLLLPAGQFARAAGGHVAQPDGVEDRHGAGANLLRIAVDQRQRKRDVLVGGKDRNEIEGLKYETEMMAPKQGQLLAIQVRDALSADHHLAAGRRIQTANEVEQRGLAGTGGAGDRQERPAFHPQTDAAEGRNLGAAAAIHFGHVVHQYHGFSSMPGRRRRSRRSRAPEATTAIYARNRSPVDRASHAPVRASAEPVELRPVSAR